MFVIVYTTQADAKVLAAERTNKRLQQDNAVSVFPTVTITISWCAVSQGSTCGILQGAQVGILVKSTAGIYLTG